MQLFNSLHIPYVLTVQREHSINMKMPLYADAHAWNKEQYSRLLSKRWLPAEVTHLQHDARLGQFGEGQHHPFNPAHSTVFANKNIMGIKSRAGMQVKGGGGKREKKSSSAHCKFIVITIMIIIIISLLMMLIM